MKMVLSAIRRRQQYWLGSVLKSRLTNYDKYEDEVEDANMLFIILKGYLLNLKIFNF